MGDKDYPEWMDDEFVPAKPPIPLREVVTEIFPESPVARTPPKAPPAETPPPKARPARTRAPKARSGRNFEWEAKVKGLLKAELKRRNLSYQQLVEKLAVVGVAETEPNIRNKLARGKFTAVFLFQCLSAIGATRLSLDLD